MQSECVLITFGLIHLKTKNQSRVEKPLSIDDDHFNRINILQTHQKPTLLLSTQAFTASFSTIFGVFSRAELLLPTPIMLS